MTHDRTVKALRPDFSGAYPEYPRVAVGAVVFHNDRVLLVKRGKPPAEGVWAIPGGTVHLGESLQETARREILEETGIIIQTGEVIYVFEKVERDTDGRVRFHYVIIDLLADYVGGNLQPGDDAKDACWVSREDLSILELSEKTRQLLRSRFGFLGRATQCHTLLKNE